MLQLETATKKTAIYVKIKLIGVRKILRITFIRWTFPIRRLIIIKYAVMISNPKIKWAM